MCGLSAIAVFGAAADLMPSLRAMHDRIPHRGPDGEGFAVVDAAWDARLLGSTDDPDADDVRLGLAFRWLKIQDFDSEAGQPMVSADGRYWLIFNGEIYNFQRLRDELGELGHQFRTVGDTEVLLAALGQWGADAFARLIGMWAIVLFDAQTRTLTVSRDRFGIKPLFYRIEPGRITFASEVKQLVDPGAPANRSAVARFVLGLQPDSAETFFEGVLAVPAGTYARIDLASTQCDLEFQSYWVLQPDRRTETRFEDNAEQLERVLTETIRDHLLAQAPVGILLSGGLDSSLVTAMASAAALTDPPPTFSMTPADAAPRYDESRYIDAVASHAGVVNHKARFSPEWLRSNLARVTMAQEQPVAGMAVAAQYFTFELAAAHGRRVVLDGQGADEMFAGYPRHQFAWLRELARRGRIWSAGANLLRIALREPSFLADLWRTKLLARFRRTGPSRSQALLRGGAPPISQSAEGTNLDAILRGDVFGGNLYAVLAVTDRNAMAHAIEARVPFVDPRIAEFAFGLSDLDKLGAGQRKRILRAVARRVPEEIIERTDRIGFGVPVEAWLRTHFIGEVEALRTAPWLDGVLVSRQAVDRLVTDFLGGQPGIAREIWRMIAIDCWVRTYAVSGL